MNNLEPMEKKDLPKEFYIWRDRKGQVKAIEAPPNAELPVWAESVDGFVHVINEPAYSKLEDQFNSLSLENEFLTETLLKFKTAMDKIYREGGQAMEAVLLHWGQVHPFNTEIQSGAQMSHSVLSKESPAGDADVFPSLADGPKDSSN